MTMISIDQPYFETRTARIIYSEIEKKISMRGKLDQKMPILTIIQHRNKSASTLIHWIRTKENTTENMQADSRIFLILHGRNK